MSAKEIAELAQEKVKKVETKVLPGRRSSITVLGREHGTATDDDVRSALSKEAKKAAPVEIKSQKDFYFVVKKVFSSCWAAASQVNCLI